MHDVANLSLLDDVRQTLKHLTDDFSQDTIADNLALIKALSEPNRIVGLLDDLLDDEVTLEWIARRSYRHVNHFDKLVLVDSESPAGYRLTLHLWRPPYTAEERDDEIIHSHRFSFWSAILTGALCSENFEVADRGTRFRKYSYIPDELTKGNLYEFRGEAALCQANLCAQSAGASYYLPYSQVHRVLLPTCDMTCTLVLRGPRARSHSDVYNTSYPRNDTKTINRTFRREELAERLQAVRDAVVVRCSAASGSHEVAG